MTHGQRLTRRRKAEAARAARAALRTAIGINAKGLCRGVPWVDKGDLIGEGWEAALRSSDSHDASRGSEFKWAVYRARRAMMRHLRKEAQLRGISRGQWESHEGELLEVPLDEARHIGRDGVADQVATRHLVAGFVATLPAKHKDTCRAMLAGAETVHEALCSLGRCGSMARQHTFRLRRRLACFVLRGKHEEGLVV